MSGLRSMLCLALLLAVGGCANGQEQAAETTAVARAVPPAAAPAPSVAEPAASMPGLLEPAAPARPMVNAYLVNVRPDRPRSLVEVYDVVCGTTRTWNLAGGEDIVIAVCADEQGVGHARVRIPSGPRQDYAWADFPQVHQRDRLAR
jgi:hypothetical protein